MLQEFKDFINRGNVLDMAVGVVMGGAFGAIVSSLVDGIVMPLVSLITGGGNFSGKFVALDGNTYATIADAEAAGAATLNYGALIQATIDFLIISFVIFIFIKQITSSITYCRRNPALHIELRLTNDRFSSRRRRSQRLLPSRSL